MRAPHRGLASLQVHFGHELISIIAGTNRSMRLSFRNGATFSTSKPRRATQSGPWRRGTATGQVRSSGRSVYYNQRSPRCCDRMTADIESVSSTVPALSTPPRDYIGKGAAQMPKPFGQKTEKRRPIRFGIGCGLGTRPARVNRIVCGTVSRLADCAKHQAMSTDPLPLAAAAADQLGTTHAQHTWYPIGTY